MNYRKEVKNIKPVKDNKQENGLFIIVQRMRSVILRVQPNVDFKRKSKPKNGTQIIE